MINDAVLAVRIKRPEPKFLGILSADKYTYPSQIAVVLNPGKSWLKYGDIILVRSHVGQEIELPSGKSASIFRENQVLGKFEGEGSFSWPAKKILQDYGV